MRRALLACVGAAGGAVVTAGLTAGAAFGVTSGAQSFTITGTHNRGPAHVNAAGPIHGSGFDRSGATHDRFIFPGQGSVVVDHATTGAHPGMSAGCTFFYGERGTYQLAGGAGQYAGASGGGVYHLNDVFFAKTLPNGTCSQHAGNDLLTISAHGHTTLPRS